MIAIRLIITLAIINITLSESTYPYYCKNEDREKMCTMEYLGVCGWFSQNIKCLVYPCASTTGTICQACSNSNVNYVTLGECPEADSKPTESTTDNVNYIYTLPYLCKTEDRKRNCTTSPDLTIVCANKANCPIAACKFKSKPCEACLYPDVEIITEASTCLGLFVNSEITLIVFSILFILL